MHDEKETSSLPISEEELLKEYLKILPSPSIVGTALHSYKMTTLGKIVFASIISTMMTGRHSPFNISGDPRKVAILAKAVQSSAKYQAAIKQPGASIDSVMRALDLKHIDSRTFEQTFHVPWPL